MQKFKEKDYTVYINLFWENQDNVTYIFNDIKRRLFEFPLMFALKKITWISVAEANAVNL